MKQNTVWVSFDVPEDEHIHLKTRCAQLKIALKDFLHENLLKGLKELDEMKLKERLKKSIQESKEGKVKNSAYP